MRLLVSILLCFLTLILFTGCDTEGNSDPRFEDFFVKYYGGDGNQTGERVIQYNEGFLVFGTTSLINSTPKLFLVYTDRLGNEVWSQTYGGDNELQAVDVEIDADNNIVLAANTTSSGLNEIIFFKLSPEGNKIDSLI
ncbi:MAG: hypothetical protein AAF843_16740, partial [Bacteroidota bacterium]